MPRRSPTGEATTKLSVTIPVSIDREIDRALPNGGNRSAYVTEVLQTHFAERRLKAIRAGAATLAADINQDEPDEVYAALRKESAHAR